MEYSIKCDNAELVLDESGPLRLLVDDSIWMDREEGATKPPWTPTHRILKEIAQGCILMSGLGIGYDMRLVNEQITHIDVVEINSSVVELVSKYIDLNKTKIILADIDEYLITCSYKKYNLVYLDHREHFSKDERREYKRLIDPLLVDGGKILFWEPQGGWESNGLDQIELV